MEGEWRVEVESGGRSERDGGEQTRGTEEWSGGGEQRREGEEGNRGGKGRRGTEEGRGGGEQRREGEEGNRGVEWRRGAEEVESILTSYSENSCIYYHLQPKHIENTTNKQTNTQTKTEIVILAL